MPSPFSIGLQSPKLPTFTRAILAITMAFIFVSSSLSCACCIKNNFYNAHI